VDPDTGVIARPIRPPTAEQFSDLIPIHQRITHLLQWTQPPDDYVIHFQPYTYIEVRAGTFPPWILVPQADSIATCAFPQCHTPTWNADVPLDSKDAYGREYIPDSQYCTTHLNAGIAEHPDLAVRPRCQITPCINPATNGPTKYDNLYFCDEHYLHDSGKVMSSRVLIKAIDHTMSMDYEAICRVHAHPRYQRSPYAQQCNPLHRLASPKYIHGKPTYLNPTPSTKAKPKPTTPHIPSRSRSGRALKPSKPLVPDYEAKQYATKNAPRRLSAEPAKLLYVTKQQDPTLADYLPHQAVNIALYYRHIQQYSNFPQDHPLTSIIPLFPYNGQHDELNRFAQYLTFFMKYYNDYDRFLHRLLEPDSLEFASIITILLILHLQSSTIPASHTAPALSALTGSDERLYNDLFADPADAEEEKDDNGPMSDAASSTNLSETTSN